MDFFGCGNFSYHNKEKRAVVFVVRKFEDINSKIIPFFEEFKIKGVKHKDFIDWCSAALIIKSKNPLTEEGHKEISRLKENMNSYRV